jgi:hypothetical protein
LAGLQPDIACAAQQALALLFGATHLIEGDGALR